MGHVQLTMREDTAAGGYSNDVCTHICTCPSRSGMSLIDMRAHSWVIRLCACHIGARPTENAYS